MENLKNKLSNNKLAVVLVVLPILCLPFDLINHSFWWVAFDIAVAIRYALAIHNNEG